MLNSKSNPTRIMILLGLSLALTIIGSLVVWPVSQVQAGPTLPPRSALTTDGVNDNDNDDDDTPVVGAYIELQAGAALGGQWSQVEWQDSNGDWQPVEGWTGSLDSQGQRRWWVDAKDFGTGPFRWVIYQSAAGPTTFTGQAFSLPAEANQIVVVNQ